MFQRIDDKVQERLDALGRSGLSRKLGETGKRAAETVQAKTAGRAGIGEKLAAGVGRLAAKHEKRLDKLGLGRVARAIRESTAPTHLRHAEDIELMPEVLAASIRRPRRAAVWALYALGAGMVLFWAFALFTKIDEVSKGDGRVVPTGQNSIVSHRSGGLLKRILVAEGQEVRKDQVMLVVENGELRAQLRENLEKYWAALARSSRLQAEAAGKTEVVFPKDVLDNAPDTAERERATLRSRQENYRTELAVLEEQIRQREQALKEQESAVAALSQKLASFQSELRQAQAAGRGSVAPLEILRLQRQVKDTEGELRTEQLKIPRAQTAIVEARARLEERKNQQVSEIRKELNDAQSQAAILEKKVEELRFDERNAEVRSPVNGVVKQLRTNTIDAVVRPAEPLVEIVPLEDSLLIEARVRPSDIAFIRRGQDAVVKITAYNYTDYGGLAGRVVYISPDSIEDSGKSGETFYTVRVETAATQLVKDGKNYAIIPGMTASVQIKTGRKSVLAYLLNPITRGTRVPDGVGTPAPAAGRDTKAEIR
jgi:adhesin transport system membrane fusion protein